MDLMENIVKVSKDNEFEEGQQVKVSQHENLGKNSKTWKGRFVRNSVIVKKCGGDLYLWRVGK
jgi:hypothetical protein